MYWSCTIFGGWMCFSQCVWWLRLLHSCERFTVSCIFATPYVQICRRAPGSFRIVFSLCLSLLNRVELCCGALVETCSVNSPCSYPGECGMPAENCSLFTNTTPTYTQTNTYRHKHVFILQCFPIEENSKTFYNFPPTRRNDLFFAQETYVRFILSCYFIDYNWDVPEISVVIIFLTGMLIDVY